MADVRICTVVYTCVFKCMCVLALSAPTVAFHAQQATLLIQHRCSVPLSFQGLRDLGKDTQNAEAEPTNAHAGTHAVTGNG